MNPSNPYQLLELIQLIERRLDPADEAMLRRKLGEDQQLRQKLARVQAVLLDEQKYAIPELDQELFNPELDQLTAYLDRQLEHDAAQQFEQFVLDQPGLLFEVISAERFSHTHVDVEVSNTLEAAMQSTLSRNLPDSSPIQALQSLPETVDGQAPRTVKQRQNGKRTRKSPPNNRRQSTLQSLLVASCVVLSVVAALFWIRTQFGSEKSGIAEHEKRPNQESVSENNRPQQDQSSDAELRETPVPPLAPERTPIVKNETPKTSIIPNQTLNEANSHQATPNHVDSPKVPTEQPKSIPLNWDRTVGIVATRTDATSPWRDVRKQSQILSAESVPTLEYRTLQESWGTATFNNANMVMGGKTSVKLQLSQTNHPQIVIQELTGNLAFEGLAPETEIVVQRGNRESVLTVTSPETGIAFDSALSEENLLVLSGEISVLGETVPSAHLVSLNTVRFQEPQPHRQRPRWIATAPQSQSIVRSTGDTLKESSNVVTTLLDENAKFDQRETQLATAWSFELNPVEAVPMAAMSTNEIHREAAINWLLASNVESTIQKDAWNQIAARISDSSLPVKDWYLARRRNSPVTAALLTELSQGISANQPLFVRQTSIHMLREIAKQPYRVYDPSRPSAKAISTVHQSVRKIVTGLNSRQRNNPQRRNGQGS